ncbi:MAG: helix-turn-helix transcriptional regulator [Verrucomicrobiae bacterium]|nr:helix-turn-helix transcriptional regulator [Verrucomicrobiae bacterium]
MARKPLHPSVPKPAPLLSQREKQVAGWLGEDDTYRSIAARLRLRPDTVRHYARAIQRKLGVKTRHAAVARLMQLGIPITQKGGIDRP